MRDPLLRVRLDAGYGKQAVLKDVCFEIAPGERLGLLGGSGAGKSTLLYTLLGLLKHRGGWATGEVMVVGRNMLALPKREARRLRGKEFALVPQSPMSALNPALSLLAHFEAAWTAHRNSEKRVLLSRIFDLAERVGLPSQIDFFQRKPGQISVGQAQRCVLALALLHRPPLVIADEPTSALDPVTQTEVLRLLREISVEEGAGLLFVSHDLLSVFRLCSSVAVLSEGHIRERIYVDDIPKSRNRELRALVDALPVPADLLLQHMGFGCNYGTKVPDEGTLLTLSS